MRNIFTSMLMLALVSIGTQAQSCGGGSEDATTESASSSSSVAYTCSHDGVNYYCTNTGDCSPSSEPAEPIATSEDEVTGLAYTSYKLSTGTIIINAECGATVNFNPVENITITDNSEETVSEG